MSTRTLWTSAVVVLMMMAMAACQATPSPAPARLEPRVKLTMLEAGEVRVSVGAYNAGERRFAPDEDDANEEVRGDVRIIDQAKPSDDIRARISVMALGPLAPEEAAFPGEYRLALPEGEYRILYDLAGYGTLSTEFTVVERDHTLHLKAHPNLINPYTEYTIGDVSLSYQLGDTVEVNATDASPQG
jgi:hypothetical protein